MAKHDKDNPDTGAEVVAGVAPEKPTPPDSRHEERAAPAVPEDLPRNADGEEIPAYRLTERAYINDQLLEPGSIVSTRHKPGKHMTPINASAKRAYAMVKTEIERDPLEGMMYRADDHRLADHHVKALDKVAQEMDLHPTLNKDGSARPRS